MAHAGAVDITRLSPDDEAGCVEAVALLTAAAKLDCPEQLLPTPRSYAAHLRHGWDGDPAQAYLARDIDGFAAGLLTVELPTYDNTNLAWLEVEVHPDYRGRGIGSELVRYAEQLARRVGRNSIGMTTWDLPKAAAFAEHHGYEQKAIEVNRRQDIAGLDWSLVEDLYADAVRASSAYELVRITGRLPEELLEDMVAVTASINDAPKDDLDIEDDEYSPERLLAYEEAQLAHDRNLYRVIARQPRDRRTGGAFDGHGRAGAAAHRRAGGHSCLPRPSGTSPWCVGEDRHAVVAARGRAGGHPAGYVECRVQRPHDRASTSS